MQRSLSLLVTVLTAVTLAIPLAHAAQLFTIQDFQFHAFDAAILKLLGYDSGTIVYVREMGAVTRDVDTMQKEHEEIGCYPFYVQRAGQTVEKGDDCRTFFCVGYLKGPQVCRDRNDRAYGGIAEINRRLGIMTVHDDQVPLTDLPDDQVTDAMRKRIDELRAIRCSPFVLMHFDVAVGEGYTCDEVGSYPYFSAANTCIVDWRKNEKSYTCKIAWRENEEELRRNAILLREPHTSSASSSRSSRSGGIRSSSGAVRSSSSSASAASSGSSAASYSSSFADVIQGKYGFTAITDLASRGIVQGYADGTFKPDHTVNRAEFAKLLVQGLFPNENKGEGYCFPDVTNQWYAPYVCAMKRLGWVAGYRDGKFKPERTLSRAEGLKIVMTSLYVPLDSTIDLPPGVPQNAWFSPYVREAIERGVLLEATFMPQASSTRADAAVWMYRARKVAGGK